MDNRYLRSGGDCCLSISVCPFSRSIDLAPSLFQVSAYARLISIASPIGAQSQILP